ncbi:hypothetical protein [Burkholderia perseverans]|uniref:hypothetical protein n=1 Tax=Burkholderia perseverans TaxID=2615214 RepID=UPI001FED58BB|nr:hypothetical protein [Burkholderia perseverans]
MKAMKAWASVGAFSCLAWLSACGGGDDGSAATAGTGTGTSSSSTGTGGSNDTPPSTTPTSNVKLADSTNNFANVRTAYAAVDALTQDALAQYSTFVTALGSPSLLAQGSRSSTYSCASGSETVTITDTDKSQSLSAGDTVLASFDNCQFTTGTTTTTYLSGSILLVVNSLTGTYDLSTTQPYHLNLDATANQLTFTTARGTTGKLNGTLSLDENIDTQTQSGGTATLKNLTYTNTSSSGNVISLATPGLAITSSLDSTNGQQIEYAGPLNVTFNNGASQLYLTVSTPAPVNLSEPTRGTIALASGDETVNATYTQTGTAASTIDITGAATLSTDAENIDLLLTQ